ncbi:hypothetical protein D3Y59_02320 [Hymenobacter oligotrophus]|uniref:Uncharacterized protein n=1 Tax=Hymenobacter oligotrophus TaxID=2319843 RepID=A0A3B7R2X3_9BACT|nr:hypothetical protein [Hymenobacter oligotrophus]AYA35991.1 hypothetical protein D3Y59_02320 [Hymenobacter oligotrophus]
MFNALMLAGLLWVGAPAPTARQALVNRPAATAQTVYVCISKSSVAYHATDDCAGLNRCTHEVRAMAVGAAQEMGKRACQKCY